MAEPILTPSSLLDAVNVLLSVIGEAPVNTLLNNQNAMVAAAQNTIDEISRRVQSEGWAFNTDPKVQLAPDVDGYINLPRNVLRVDTTEEDAGNDYVQRGTRLYDRRKASFTFTEPVYVELVTALLFEELPQPARDYITIRAARVFQARQFGSGQLAAFSEQDERDARAVLVAHEAETDDVSLLEGFARFRPGNVVNRRMYLRGY